MALTAAATVAACGEKPEPPIASTTASTTTTTAQPPTCAKPTPVAVNSIERHLDKGTRLTAAYVVRTGQSISVRIPGSKGSARSPAYFLSARISGKSVGTWLIDHATTVNGSGVAIPVSPEARGVTAQPSPPPQPPKGFGPTTRGYAASRACVQRAK
jgi:hypothetical protein